MLCCCYDGSQMWGRLLLIRAVFCADLKWCHFPKYNVKGLVLYLNVLNKIIFLRPSVKTIRLLWKNFMDLMCNLIVVIQIVFKIYLKCKCSLNLISNVFDPSKWWLSPLSQCLLTFPLHTGDRGLPWADLRSGYPWHIMCSTLNGRDPIPSASSEPSHGQSWKRDIFFKWDYSFTLFKIYTLCRQI